MAVVATTMAMMRPPEITGVSLVSRGRSIVDRVATRGVGCAGSDQLSDCVAQVTQIPDDRRRRVLSVMKHIDPTANDVV